MFRWQAKMYEIWGFWALYPRFWASIWKLGSRSGSALKLKVWSGFASNWKVGSGSASSDNQDPEHRTRLKVMRIRNTAAKSLEKESLGRPYGTYMPRIHELSYRPASLRILAGRYDNSIPTRFRAPKDCSKIPAQGKNFQYRVSYFYISTIYKPEQESKLTQVLSVH